MAEYTLKKVANMTEVTTPADTDFMYIIAGGLDRKIYIAALKSMLSGSNALTGVFTNGDLNAYGQYIINHNKGTYNIVITIFNPNGVQQQSSGIVYLQTNDIAILNFGGEIDAGDWRYILQYYIT